MRDERAEHERFFHQLRGNPSFVEALVEGSNDGLLLVDGDCRVRDLNDTLLGWLQASRDAVIGTVCHEVLLGARDLCGGGQDGETCPARIALRTSASAEPRDLVRKPDAGKPMLLQVRAHPVEVEGEAACALLILRDVTALRMLEAYRDEAALRDAVTGLYNRRAYLLRLDREVKRAQRQGHPVSLCLLDIDSFKDFNERKGEEEGDVLLGRVARLLTDTTRKEVDTVFRLEGDLFAVILPEASPEQARNVADRVRSGEQDAQLPVTFSMVVCGAQKDEEPELLHLRAADALFAAKKAGGNRMG